MRVRIGVAIATQNPLDLDYRALSNAGLWCRGRLQTDVDRARVVDGLRMAGTEGASLGAALKKLAPRWFVLRDAHVPRGVQLLQWAMSFMRGPMTRAKIPRARAELGDR